MKRIMTRWAQLLFAMGVGLICLHPAESQSLTEKDNTFIKLQHDWAEARKHQDITFLERFYAKEFTVGTLDGGEVSRAADIEKFSSGDLKPAVITDDQLVVHVYGQAALVTGLEHLQGTYKGRSGQFDLRFANVYVFRDGRWQMVRHQATPVAKR
jgi:ketosteroid isomerase-like protein